MFSANLSPNFATKLVKRSTNLVKYDHKIILFSEWTTMLDLIEPVLKQNNVKYVRLDGPVPQKKRQAFVQVFLLSSKPAAPVVQSAIPPLTVLPDKAITQPEHQAQIAQTGTDVIEVLFNFDETLLGKSALQSGNSAVTGASISVTENFPNIQKAVADAVHIESDSDGKPVYRSHCRNALSWKDCCKMRFNY